MPGKLFLIPTFLDEESGIETLSVEAVKAVSLCTVFLAENERTARRFIGRLKLGIGIESLKIFRLDKDTAASDLAEPFALCLSGQHLGVLSEAGCPGVADPGSLAVAWAHKNNIEVVPLVGPSSVLLALMASGFNGQSFVFHGYLPVDRLLRAKKIQVLEKTVTDSGQTQLFIETPYRNQALLEDLVRHCRSTTLLCIAAGLTGPSQFIRTAPISFWKTNFPDLHRKPALFLLGV